jgi:hypothetical protein
LEIAEETRPDLHDPHRVFEKFKVHHNGSEYLPQEWVAKWRLWLLNEHELRPGRRSPCAEGTRAPGSFLSATRPRDLSADYEEIPNGR